jgi:hypothetical protein
VNAVKGAIRSTAPEPAMLGVKGDAPDMRLELLWSDVTAVTAGAATRLAGGVLGIDLGALQGLLEADPRLERVRIDLASPGESCRIGRVFDVFAPRAKDDGDEDFPGVLGPSPAPAAVRLARSAMSRWSSPISSSTLPPRSR